MKICCLIDSLGAGGAQRQMTALVGALSQRGYEVTLLTYHKFDHFLPDVQQFIEPKTIESSSRLGRFWSLRREVRKQRPDCIISFLDTPNLLGVFSSLPPDRIPIIVSERSLDTKRTLKNSTRLNAFRLADKVVTNSQAQAAFIQQHYPFLSDKIEVIRNTVDLSKFSPKVRASQNSNLRLLVAASVIAVKNAHRLIEAIRIANSKLKDAGRPLVTVDWFGNNLFNWWQTVRGLSLFFGIQKTGRRSWTDRAIQVF